MSEFSARPFAAGSVVGLRGFSVDTLGRLIGPSYGQVFHTGENLAECRKDRMQAIGWYSLGGLVGWGPSGAITADPLDAVESKRPKPEHTIGGLGCGCGFYAYFDGCNDYVANGHASVGAIIEGYGVCTVGSRGFKASKARLLAIIVSDSFASSPRIERNYDGIPFYRTQDKAVAAHPLTESELPTPADDDFWTRNPQ